MYSRRPHNCKNAHFTSQKERLQNIMQRMKHARAKRAKILFFIVKYANLWDFCGCRRRGCLSFLMFTGTRRKISLLLDQINQTLALIDRHQIERVNDLLKFHSIQMTSLLQDSQISEITNKLAKTRCRSQKTETIRDN